ncbi:MAG: Transcriptional regulator [uncultured Thermomicrobiales bacterium]|uniref:Transcriptional regulator n=1 Tax=uncultured Thermomicrobiales bacterium TaxID=1645740 RepID=A0A6J4V805_9BACT|nr:MAG: Transcriptional regulator [uncultured Thermomicrobiales bacterium]
MADDRVDQDFDRARQRAFLHDVVATVRRQPNDLVSFHDIRQRVSPERESYRGLQIVPINQIVGSMDRFQDFDRAFLPRQRHTARRWKSVDKAFYDDVTLPPIQLYKVGDIYFVKDGNHRVSVARQRGGDYIDAEVIEGHIRVPLTASMSPQELLLQVEYAEFLRQTDIDRSRPDHDIRPTALGRYDEILEHIRGHQAWLTSIWHRPASMAEAVVDWYDHIYLPIVRVVARRGVLDRFPSRTDADVYLWVMRHRGELEHRVGQDVGPLAAAEDYANEVVEHSGPVNRLVDGTRSLLRRFVPDLAPEPSERALRPITPDPFPLQPMPLEPAEIEAAQRAAGNGTHLPADLAPEPAASDGAVEGPATGEGDRDTAR